MSDDHEKIRITWDEVNKADGTNSTSAPTQNPTPAPRLVPGTSHRWWDRNGKTKAAVGIAVAVVLAGVLVLWRVDASHRNNPLVTINVVDSVTSENDLARNKDYFTPKGYSLVQWMISQGGESQEPSMRLSYAPPEISGDSCQVWGTSGNTRMAIRLVKGDRWLFDDIYIASIDGRDVNLLATYIRDNPMKTWFKMSWPDLLNSFLQGFLLGLSGGG